MLQENRRSQVYNTRRRKLQRVTSKPRLRERYLPRSTGQITANSGTNHPDPPLRHASIILDIEATYRIVCKSIPDRAANLQSIPVSNLPTRP
jgi:hypothetical protein